MVKERMCRLERLLITLGFRLVHDGQQNPGQFVFPPEELKLFTREYQLYMDGKPLHTWAEFKYDRRSKFVDFDLRFSEPGEKGRRQHFRLSGDNTKEVFNGETKSVSTEQNRE